MNKYAKKIAALENNLENKLPKLEKKLLATLADPPNQNVPANAEDPREWLASQHLAKFYANPENQLNPHRLEFEARGINHTEHLMKKAADFLHRAQTEFKTSKRSKNNLESIRELNKTIALDKLKLKQILLGQTSTEKNPEPFESWGEADAAADRAYQNAYRRFRLNNRELLTAERVIKFLSNLEDNKKEDDYDTTLKDKTTEPENFVESLLLAESEDQPISSPSGSKDRTSSSQMMAEQEEEDENKASMREEENDLSDGAAEDHEEQQLTAAATRKKKKNQNKKGKTKEQPPLVAAFAFFAARIQDYPSQILQKAGRELQLLIDNNNKGCQRKAAKSFPKKWENTLRHDASNLRGKLDKITTLKKQLAEDKRDRQTNELLSKIIVPSKSQTTTNVGSPAFESQVEEERGQGLLKKASVESQRSRTGVKEPIKWKDLSSPDYAPQLAEQQEDNGKKNKKFASETDDKKKVNRGAPKRAMIKKRRKAPQAASRKPTN